MILLASNSVTASEGMRERSREMEHRDVVKGTYKNNMTEYE